MKRYEPKNFEKNYTNYLLHLLVKGYEFCESKEVAEKKCNKIALDLRKKGKIIKDRSERSYKLYIDPDNKKNDKFYSDLSNFLNAARISRKNNKILSFEANEAPYGMITVYYKTNMVINNTLRYTQTSLVSVQFHVYILGRIIH